MTARWMCLACARGVEDCVCAGTDAARDAGRSRRVLVADDAAERAEAGGLGADFIRRRSVMPAPRPFGQVKADRAHELGECNSRSCPRCALVEQMRGGTS